MVSYFSPPPKTPDREEAPVFPLTGESARTPASRSMRFLSEEPGRLFCSRVDLVSVRRERRGTQRRGIILRFLGETVRMALFVFRFFRSLPEHLAIGFQDSDGGPSENMAAGTASARWRSLGPVEQGVTRYELVTMAPVCAAGSPPDPCFVNATGTWHRRILDSP